MLRVFRLNNHHPGAHHAAALRRWLSVGVLIAVIVGGLGISPVTHAQDGADAVTQYQLNMRTGPGLDYDVLTVLASQTGLTLEARDADASWLLARTADGAHRGWVASLYLTFGDGVNALALPLSDEVMPAPPPVIAEPPASDPSGAADSANDDAPISPADGAPSASQAPHLDAIPLVSGVGPRTRTIFERGQALGNDPTIVTKVGECNSMSWAFLRPFNVGAYDLGDYGYLQSTIDAFYFVENSAATAAGYTSAQVLDSFYADPGRCRGLAPLECEYQDSRPSVAFIMLGMQDVNFLTSQQYTDAMREIIELSIEYGVIPVITTFPVWADGSGKTNQRIIFNTILVNLAREYGVPLAHFWKASQDVQNAGVGVDHVHITERYDNFCSFTGEQFAYGMDMWNLVALQTLAAIQQQVN